MLKEFTVQTKSRIELVDITSGVKAVVRDSKIRNGLCCIYVPHATAAVTINENADPNLQSDILKVLNRIVPKNDSYLHDRIDNNADSHIKAAIMGPSETIPVKDSELMLGTWQDIFLAEFDGPRMRRVIITVLGDKALDEK